MALGTYVAGRYSGTYDSVDVGHTADGYTLDQQFKAELLDQTDAHAESLIDGVYRGGECTLAWRSKEYKAGSLGALVNMGGVIGVISTTTLPVGRLLSAMAKAMVLTATANTPAAAAPATLTAPGGILAPNYPVSLLFDSRLREVPIRLQLLPELATGTLRWFVIT